MSLKNWLRKNGIIFLLIVAILGALSWTYLHLERPPAPPPPEERVTFVYRPDYEIVSRKGVSIWPEGTKLEQGRAAYFFAASPVVNVTPTVVLQGDEKVEIQGTVESKLFVQAVTDKGAVYWSYPLGAVPVQRFTLSHGLEKQADQLKATAQNITLDVQTAFDEIIRINTELTFESAVFQLACVTDVQFSGTVNDRAVKESFQNILPVNIMQERFTIPVIDENTTRIVLNEAATNQVVTEPTLTELLQYNQKPVMADAALILLLILLLIVRKLKSIKGKTQQRRFKEWITDGTVQIKGLVNIDVHTLEGLVDLAIDLDKRVIFDPEKEKYYVLEENLVYTYNPEKSKVNVKSDQKKLGKLLLEHGVLLPEQLEIGLMYHQKFQRQLGESLIDLGFIDEITLYSTIAAQKNMSFIELDPEQQEIDRHWLMNMTLDQARALEAVPLGKREDGKLVVACADPFKRGVQEALQELFKLEIVTIAARPSAIYKLIEQMYSDEQRRRSVSKKDDLEQIFHPHGLAQEEWQRFKAGYEEGSLRMDLYLKASDLVGQTVIAHAPQKELLLQWLSNKAYVDNELAQLMAGMKLAVSGMEQGLRQELKVPALGDVLVQANFLTPANYEWVKREMDRQGLPLEQTLTDSFLTSAATVKKALWLLHVLENILIDSKNEMPKHIRDSIIN